MREQLGETFRKLSFALIFAGMVGECYSEAFANVPVDKYGRPKPPVWKQRLAYLGVIGCGVPGVAWGIVRAARGQRRTPWE